MKNARFLVIVILLVVVALGGWYFLGNKNSSTTGSLTTSGTVETNQVLIAPEISGRIVEINVQEGDLVKAGDVLFKLDDSILKAQRTIAAANLETAMAAEATSKSGVATAQTQYDIALSAALVKDIPVRTQDWYKTTVSEFTLPDWYYSQGEQVNAAQTVIDDARKRLDDAQAKLKKVQSQAGAEEFVMAESALAAAQTNFLVAKNLYNRAWAGKSMDDLSRRQLRLLARDAYLDSKDVATKWVTLTASVNQDLRDSAQKIYDDAKTTLDDAQTRYSDAISANGTSDILSARAEVNMALENYNTALDFARGLQTGADAPAVVAAQRVLDQAGNVSAQAAAGIKQAQANLDMLDVQINKTVIIAPLDGVVLTRAGEPGSVVNPGGAVLVMGRLDELTITVYVPEDRMGEVSMGQTASVKVDSFPGQSFDAVVTYLSDQAEFTPRNVQTVEGRKNTVFAVKLKLNDTAGKLKPGMPADVTFGAK